MNYGIPYMGSKNRIAKWVLEQIPSADNFYDLFCGGCAITHCAIEQRKFKNYFINDIKEEMPKVFIKGINGGFKNENKWISHKEFDKLKGKGDIYVDVCFSFGNNWHKGYAYSKKIEPLKKAAHYAIFFKDCLLMDEIGIDVRGVKKIGTKKDRYLAFKKIIKPIVGHFQLESLERLQRLQSLSDIVINNDITQTSTSYSDVKIKPNSVIYCDIPYRNTEKYQKNEFDYDSFYKWALGQKEPIFISEYWMPDDFICIAEKERTSSMSATNKSLRKTEKIFVPKHQFNKYVENSPLLFA